MMLNDATSQFLAAMRAAGLEPPDVIELDKFMRFPGVGKEKGNTAGWCRLFPDGTGGVFGDWSSGFSETWQAERDKPFSPEEREAFKRRVAEAHAKAEAEHKVQQGDAARQASEYWNAAAEAPEDHPYLVRKGIKPHGAHVYNGALLIPLFDNGKLQSLQFIRENGEKRFLKDGRISGCYFEIGDPESAQALCIVEGFATGATINEATGYPVVVAFNASNLHAVAQLMRERFPRLKLIVCADNDAGTEGNPGMTKGKEAAQAVGGLLAIPDFGDDRTEAMTDFNDMAAKSGLQAVKEVIEKAVEPVARFPTEQERPCWRVYDQSVKRAGRKYDPGVYRHDVKAKDGDTQLIDVWICDPLYVDAQTRDNTSSAWGRLLRWYDEDGQMHKWAMPMSLLEGDGADMRRELAHQGLKIAPGRQARELLENYIKTQHTKDRARCVDRLGWHGGVYVTPSEVIGQSNDMVVFQNAGQLDPALAVSGTVEQWRNSVGKLAAGNSRLVFVLSAAFAGPLVDLAGEDSGGFHLRGASSSGKSTALKAAASVWGKPEIYVRLWRATANGLEGIAAMHNDGLLILDELSQIEGREAGQCAYMLANGQGKARASRTGMARQAAHWRLMLLSSGEVSLAALMAEAGKKANAGQEIRLADIEADAGAGLGLFNTLHDYDKPGALAQGVKDAASLHYGAVGVEWLRKIVAHRAKLPDVVNDEIKKFVTEVAPKDAAGQVGRVARRFGLVAVAGELATHYGLTGWDEGEAYAAACTCFAAWLEGFGGTGNREERTMLSQVRAFFEMHGASRFESMTAGDEQRVINRAGFFRDKTNDPREFLVLPGAFKNELCKGLDSKAVEKLLRDKGWIDLGGDGRVTQKLRLPGISSTTRVYVFNGKMWGDDE